MLILVCVFVVVASIGWVRTIGFNNPPDSAFDFDKMPTTDWDFYVNGVGQVHPPPYHVGNTYTQDGSIVMTIANDPGFESRPRKRVDGEAASRLYNNIFGMMRIEYMPTLGKNVEVATRFRMPTTNGSGGILVESSKDFDSNGHLNSWGFRGAVGVSYFGEESSDAISGMHFTYTIGFIPVCNVKVEGVDVTDWHEYTIVWQKTLIGHSYTLSVDGVKKATCSIPFVGFTKSNLQIWRDNYYIPDGINIDFQNFDETQSIEYDWVKVRVVNK